MNKRYTYRFEITFVCFIQSLNSILYNGVYKKESMTDGKYDTQNRRTQCKL